MLTELPKSLSNAIVAETTATLEHETGDDKAGDVEQTGQEAEERPGQPRQGGVLDELIGNFCKVTLGGTIVLNHNSQSFI